MRRWAQLSPIEGNIALDLESTHPLHCLLGHTPTGLQA